MNPYDDSLEDLEEDWFSEAALIRHYLEEGNIEPARIRLLKKHKEKASEGEGLNSYNQANLETLVEKLDGRLMLYREVQVIADDYDIEF